MLKSQSKKVEKTFEKVLTNKRACDILFKLSTRGKLRERKESRKAETKKDSKKS